MGKIKKVKSEEYIIVTCESCDSEIKIFPSGKTETLYKKKEPDEPEKKNKSIFDKIFSEDEEE